jgi:hypothetical protein
MKMTDKIWEEIVDEESQALGVEATYIRLVSRRSIDKVLASISEQGTLEAVEKAIREQWTFPVIQNMDEWIAGVLARLTAPKPPSKQERVTVDSAKVYLDGKWIAGFPYGEINGTHPGLGKDRAERYAAGLRQELEAQNGK